MRDYFIDAVYVTQVMDTIKWYGKQNGMMPVYVIQVMDTRLHSDFVFIYQIKIDI